MLAEWDHMISSLYLSLAALKIKSIHMTNTRWYGTSHHGLKALKVCCVPLASSSQPQSSFLKKSCALKMRSWGQHHMHMMTSAQPHLNNFRLFFGTFIYGQYHVSYRKFHIILNPMVCENPMFWPIVCKIVAHMENVTLWGLFDLFSCLFRKLLYHVS